MERLRWFERASAGNSSPSTPPGGFFDFAIAEKHKASLSDADARNQCHDPQGICSIAHKSPDAGRTLNSQVNYGASQQLA
ncbi:hypothetical protein E5288_WYG011834 [Bos mutus]|uniref:Uncharacterized protein n=1 Tax=Bos mutus TaxID=72004 RepID=A0A6B0RS13_9CETA|nr:hypothetical protein [Bos mutus]